MAERIVVIGAGGQAREISWLVRDLARHGERVAIAGFVVSDLSRLKRTDSADLVLGDLTWVRQSRESFDGLAIGIGDPGARLQVASELGDFDPSWWPALVHPRAIVGDTCRVGHGVLVGAGAIVTVGVTLHPFCLVNFGTTVGHEAEIGEGSVVNPGASVAGGVRIGRRVLVGSGAQILQYLSVGDGAVVGAGAVVTRDVAAGETVVGAPARPLQRHSRKERD